MSSDSNIRVGRELGAPNISCHTDSASCAKSLSDLAEVLVRKSLHVTLDLRSSGDTGVRIDGGHISCHVWVLDHRDWQGGTSKPERQKLVCPLLLLI